MRYVIVGAGAIGGTLASRLAQNSIAHPPVIIARGENAKIVRRHGLRLRSPDDDAMVPIAVANSPAEVTLRDDDVLVFATKTQQVQSALLEWADQPVHDAHGRAASTAGSALPAFMALNGVEGERIALRLFDRVFGVCIALPAIQLRAGELFVPSAPTTGAFILGRYGSGAMTDDDRRLLTALASDWRASTFDVRVVDDVMRWKYSKLIRNLANAVQALVGPADDVDDIVSALREEGRAVLDIAGIATASAEGERAWRAALPPPRPVAGMEGEFGSSSWQSLTRGSGTIETDYLNGEIVLIGRAHGMEAPMNAAIQAAARQAAAERRRPGTMSPEELRRLVLLR